MCGVEALYPPLCPIGQLTHTQASATNNDKAVLN